MISALVFLVIAVALFFWVLSPFFKDFEQIKEGDLNGRIREMAKTNMDGVSTDYELGKTSAEELKEIENSLRQDKTS